MAVCVSEYLFRVSLKLAEPMNIAESNFLMSHSQNHRTFHFRDLFVKNKIFLCKEETRLTYFYILLSNVSSVRPNHNFDLYCFKAANFWIGISDMIDDGRWIYSSNQEVIQVSGWNPDEPNGNTGENCVAMWHSFHGRWADLECGVALSFICEADIEYVHLCKLSVFKF